MKSIAKNIFINLYFIFQCIATVINFIIFIFVIISSFMIYGLGGENRTTITDQLIFFTIAGVIIILAQILVILTPISAISTIKIKQKKILTKLQKFSTIIFPVIIIPLYITIIIFYLKHIIY